MTNDNDNLELTLTVALEEEYFHKECLDLRNFFSEVLLQYLKRLTCLGQLKNYINSNKRVRGGGFDLGTEGTAA